VEKFTCYFQPLHVLRESTILVSSRICLQPIRFRYFISVSSGGLVSITNSTVRENNIVAATSTGGGGIENQGGIFRIQNTIVANNLSGSVGFSPDCRGTITTLGNNLVGDPSGCDINLQPSDLTGDPGLGSLVGTEEDASPGQAYYPVLAGSPVIDKGNLNACPPTDQLGNARVGVCDIGAIEFEPVAVLTVAFDVRPGNTQNQINPNSNGVIPVAILSTNSFELVQSIKPVKNSIAEANRKRIKG
jgi:hypothetical protein